MFRKFFRPLFNNLRAPRVLLTTSAIVSYTLLKNQLRLDSPEEDTELEQGVVQKDIYKDLNRYIKELKRIELCDSAQLQQSEKKEFVVKDAKGDQHRIIVYRLEGQLYAFLGSCPHREPFDAPDKDYSLKDAFIFNEKMYCPHHGCIFSVKTGNTQHGPSLHDLPIFRAEEVEGKVTLLYPSVVPRSVLPNMVFRDVQDLRKVLILGGDDGATIGCINGLRQFGYEGEITVVKQGPYMDPYKKEYLHKIIPNLHLHDTNKDWEQKLQAQKKQQDAIRYKLQQKFNVEEKKEEKLSAFNQKGKQPRQKYKTTEKNKYQLTIEEYIEDQLEKKVYNQLKYYNDSKWYEKYGVDFVFNNEAFRIINKQYYPYVTFYDGTKIQYDGLLIATGLVHKLPAIEGITTDEARSLNINLPQNVFCPIRSKEQHIKFSTFMNKNIIKNLLVLGYNIESLEFISALKQEFPDVKITVLDTNKDSPLTEHLGPELEKTIVKDYTKHGVDFFIKIRDQVFYSNKFSQKNLEKQKTGVEKKPTPKILAKIKEAKKQNKEKSQNLPSDVKDSRLKYENSITARLSDGTRIKVDGVVVFPPSFSGNNHWVKNGKYTDFEYLSDDRLSGDTFCRTDNIRIFTAGMGSICDYYLNQKRLVHTNPQISFQQGYNSALNILALRIPFTYVPFEKFKFFDRELYYIGTRDFYDRMLTIGSIGDWDFLSIYALGNEIRAVSASPSKRNLLSIIRESYRINCLPAFQDVLSGYWSIENLANLIKRLNKSGCYKQTIFKNRDHVHKKDLIFMERTADAGFENDRPQGFEDYPQHQIDSDGNLKQL